ncbi:hypothetical protein R69746_07683 [Paraburkholderia aspalathi]|uniref:toll/interleukin-1 receptor domain-containing protein n=1 Tax=Paraburkholderia aspalathi TaxID=1324617 RepID=UPI00190B1B76|nr:toll/interleukin-1 receptor domain-containing protein [Paraburkholderia aspalathi]MBK3843672.1 hypothetical protein [Paraburkholderia aspalathi]CAE6858202.1 hypothetical protein R69746_07683 [Paraburkholderia aspalathi]
MRVFLSWSGDLSKQVATAFSGFLQRVIQSAKPWISAGGIPSGGVWFTEIMNQLNDSQIGVLFVTQENKTNPWLMFEAGAIAKGLPQNRVCALLIDCKPEDIKPPLSQFQLTLWQKEGVLELLRTINAGLGENRLADDVLKDVMEAQWIKFETEVTALMQAKPAKKTPERSERELLVEILETVRAMERTRNLPHGLPGLPSGFAWETYTIDPARVGALSRAAFEAGVTDSGNGIPLSSVLQLPKSAGVTFDEATGVATVRTEPPGARKGVGMVENPNSKKKR